MKTDRSSSATHAFFKYQCTEKAYTAHYRESLHWPYLSIAPQAQHAAASASCPAAASLDAAPAPACHEEEEGLQGVFKRLCRNGHQLEKGCFEQLSSDCHSTGG
jgi:hypothetical protein